MLWSAQWMSSIQIMVGRAKAFELSSQTKASLICSLRVSGDSDLKE